MYDGSIGIIGAGFMARGIIGGLRASGVAASRISVGDPVASQLEETAREFGVRTSSDNAAVAREAGLLILAVKRQNMRAVANGLQTALAARRPLVVSVAAGVRLDDLSGWLGGYDALVRTMPNRPALLRKGVTALFAHRGVS